MKPKRILVVDDVDYILNLFRETLAPEGYEVRTERSGYRAMVAIREEEFDLVFLDIMMPGLNGVDTVRELKWLRPETVVVMITGYADEELVNEAISRGAVTCLRKPFSTADILKTVNQYLGNSKPKRE